MTYSALEISAFNGRPFFLYEWTEAQTEAQWHFTAHEQPITTFQGSSFEQTWEPRAIVHSEIKQNSNIEKQNVQITFPISDAFARRFIGDTLRPLTTVTIFRGHWGDPDDFVAYWKGRIISTEVSGERIIFTCENIYSGLRQAGLRARYQRTCRHVLYSKGCRLDVEDFYAAATITAVVNERRITVASVGGNPDNYYTGGIANFDGELRFIEEQIGTSITLSSGMPTGTTTSTPLTIAPGCDRARATCGAKFNNIVNFGGFPFIPDKNPFALSSIV